MATVTGEELFSLNETVEVTLNDIRELWNLLDDEQREFVQMDQAAESVWRLQHERDEIQAILEYHPTGDEKADEPMRLRCHNFVVDRKHELRHRLWAIEKIDQICGSTSDPIYTAPTEADLKEYMEAGGY
jgi:hypothetical protein